MTNKRTRSELGIELTPTNVEGIGGTNLTREGELATDSSDNELKARLGGATRTVVTENQTQSLTNKTIDVDNNTISNIETDNLKAGVLNTSGTLAGATDTQVPSALAVKTLTDTKVTGPASSTDNAITRYDGTTGKLVQDSLASVSDTGSIAANDYTLTDANFNTLSAKELISNISGTGVSSGGIVSIGTPNTTVSISDGVGYIAVNTGGTSSVKKITWTGLTNQSLTFLSTNLITYLAINASGTLVQQVTPYTNSQSRDLIVIGAAVHTNLTNVNAVNQLQNVLLSPVNQLDDLQRSLGFFNVSGNIYSPNGTNLNINKSAGVINKLGSNWDVDPKNPNVRSLASGTAITFRYRFQNSTELADTTTINPNIYDVGGVSTAVPSNRFTIQRINVFSSNLTRIQLGQNVYNSLADALAAIQTETFITETNIAENGLLRGFLIVREGVTDLTDSSRAYFLEAPKFGGASGVGGLSTTTLQGAYNNSTTPQITTSTTLGSVDLKRGSAADSDAVFRILNGAGAATVSISGAGTVIGAAIDASTNTLTNITNTSIAAAAAIARSKLASGTNNAIVHNDGSGVMTNSSDFTATTNEVTLGNTKHIALQAATDSTTTGANASLTAFTAGTIRLTNASLVSIANIPAGSNGQELTLDNRTGVAIAIVDSASAVGTAANRIFTGTGAQITVAANSSITLHYDSTSARWQVVGGTGSGTSGSSGINYITNFNAEVDTTGWATYADAAGTAPVDGTGNINSPTPVAVTLTRTTSSPLRGTGSFLITKDAVNRQGQGVSYDFTIDTADRAKVIQGSFDYSIASGTFVDNDLSVWIYDVTNSVLIQPAPYLIKNSTITERMPFEFQTASNSSSYRLIIHVASTSTSAYTIKLDNFNVGPQSKLYGSPITDWISYTPTASWTTNVSSVVGKYRRVGDTLEGNVIVTLNGANTQGSLSVTIPSGLTPDTSKMNVSAGAQEVGTVRISDANGSGLLTGVATANGGTSIAALVHQLTAASANSSIFEDNVNSSTNKPITFATGDTVTIQFKVPIVGWSSSTIMSSDADTRVIAASYVSNPTTGTIANNTTNVVAYSTLRQDTHGAYNTSTGLYTVPVTGFYAVDARWAITGTITVGSSFNNIAIAVSGSTVLSSTKYADLTAEIENSISGIVYATAGQTISVLGQPGGVTSPAHGTTLRNTFTIFKVQGPAQISSSESVNVLYTGAPPTGTLGAASNLVTYGTKIKDSHNAYNSGLFTVPMSGCYDVATGISVGATFTAGQLVIVVIAIDGSDRYQGTERIEVAGTVNGRPQLTVKSIPLLAGQTISTRSFVQGSSPAFEATSVYNFLSISRSGNF